MLKKLYNFSNSWVGTILIVLIIIFFVAQAFVIPSGSMKRTLLIGDHLFVKKFAYGIPTPHIPWLEIPVLPDFNGNGHLITAAGPQRGDIVVFRYPKNTKTHYVKRCVAIGGDKLQLINKALYIRPHEGDAYIKEHYPETNIVEKEGELWVKDPYKIHFAGIQNDETIQENGRYFPQLFNFPEITIPADEYFMMGDNRDHSNDSRFWGTVPYKLIEGTPWFIYFSWDKAYRIRWNRMGHFIDAIQEDATYIDPKEPLE